MHIFSDLLCFPSLLLFCYAGVFKKLAMMCPLMIVFYNLFMGGVDGSDRLKLNRHGSLELNIVCNSWVKRFILALFDMAVTNAYVIARFSNPSLTHREFLKNLHKQLLAKAQGHDIPGNRGEITGRKRRASRAFPDDSARSAFAELLDSLVQSEHSWGSLKDAAKDRKPCYVCSKRGVGFSLIKNAKGERKRPQKFRYSRGCKKCSITLCEEHFFVFHTEYLRDLQPGEQLHPSCWKDQTVAPLLPPQPRQHP